MNCRTHGVCENDPFKEFLVMGTLCNSISADEAKTIFMLLSL